MVITIINVTPGIVSMIECRIHIKTLSPTVQFWSHEHALAGTILFRSYDHALAGTLPIDIILVP